MKKHVGFNYTKVITVCLMLILLVGCSQNTDKDAEARTKSSVFKNEEDPYVVFYTHGAGSIIQNFQGAYPELNVEFHEVSGSSDGVGGIDEKIANVGEPDLMVLYLSGNAEKVIETKEKYAADIMEFYGEDTSIDPDAYLPGTFEVFKEGESLLGIPLGISLPTMTIREENWVGSAFEALNEGYSTMELLNAMEKEIDNSLINKTMYAAEWGVPFYDLLIRMGAIQKTEDSVVINEELFSKIYTVFNKQYNSHNEMSAYFESEGKALQGENGLTGLDPSNYEGEFFASSWYSGAPQVYLPYAASVNMEFFGQETYTIYYPVDGTESELGARVDIVGIVNKNSKRQQEAYDLLKMMLDTPIEYFVQPNGSVRNDGDTFFTANIENMYAMIEDFEQFDEGRFGETDDVVEDTQETLTICDLDGSLIYLIEKVSLNEEEKAKLQEALGNISFLYYNGKIELQSSEIIGRYVVDGVEDYKGCYTEYVKLYNPQMSEGEEAAVEDPNGIPEAYEEKLRYILWSGIEIENEEILQDIQLLEEKNTLEPDISSVDLSNAEVDEEQLQAVQEMLRNAEEGSAVTLGSYEQDDDQSNGAEDINWIIVEKDDEKALLISEDSLECMDAVGEVLGQGEESWSGNEYFSWEEGLIRAWLNGDFLESAFKPEEAALILNTKVYTVAGEWLEQTEDKMFILNPLEADRYLESEDLRMAGASDYAINKKILSDLPGDNKPWIMRQAVLDDMANDIQPIFPTDFVVQMGIDGQIDTEKGERATRQNYVRPAMWVYLGE